jgi:O-antigen/teichoic acid export membrane protein
MTKKSVRWIDRERERKRERERERERKRREKGGLFSLKLCFQFALLVLSLIYPFCSFSFQLPLKDRHSIHLSHPYLTFPTSSFSLSLVLVLLQSIPIEYLQKN